jgi:hypothetical protein
MDTPEEEVAWLGGLRPEAAVRALSLIGTGLTVCARERASGRSTVDTTSELVDFNERLHRILGFISQAARGKWSTSMAEGAVAQVHGLGSKVCSEDGVRRTLLRKVREEVGAVADTVD